MNWILLAVIAIIVVMGLLGWKKGLIKMVFSLASTVIALLFAAIFSPVVADLMKSNEGIVSFFDEKVGAIVDFSGEDAEENTGVQENLIEELPLPETIKDSLKENNTLEKYADMDVAGFEEYVCRQITNVILNALAFVITLAVAIIALWILCHALNILAKLPLLKQINQMTGLAAGLAEGVLLVWILFVVLTMFAGSAFGQDAMAMIGENPLLDFLYKNNLVLKFIARG